MTQYFMECNRCLALLVHTESNKLDHSKWHNIIEPKYVKCVFRIVAVPSDDVADGAN